MLIERSILLLLKMLWSNWIIVIIPLLPNSLNILMWSTIFTLITNWFDQFSFHYCHILFQIFHFFFEITFRIRSSITTFDFLKPFPILDRIFMKSEKNLPVTKFKRWLVITKSICRANEGGTDGTHGFK